MAVWYTFLLNTVFIPFVLTTGGCGSLQARIDAAAAYSTLTVPACVYREAVVIAKPLTVRGLDGAEIRGSDVWTDWKEVSPTPQASGQFDEKTRSWVSVRPVPVLPNVTDWQALYTGSPMAGDVAQVFIDGKPQTQISGTSASLLAAYPGAGGPPAPPERGSAAIPAPGQFYLDAQRHVVLGVDPRGHTVEVSTRGTAISITSSGVTLDHLTIRHGATGYQQGLIDARAVNDLTLTDLAIEDGATSGVLIRGGHHHRLSALRVLRAGMLGVDVAGQWGGPPGTDLWLTDSTITGSNAQGFNIGHHAGGAKAVNWTDLVVRKNTITDTEGTAIWLDIGASGVVVERNTLARNTAVGIFWEISPGPARITGNLIQGPGQYAVAFWTACRATVEGNIIEDYAEAIMRRWQWERADRPAGCDDDSNAIGANTFTHVGTTVIVSVTKA
jgi:hypothetical protein